MGVFILKKLDMNIKLFDYNLPPELIAQKPTSPRDHSRLLVLDKVSGSIKHKHFFDLAKLLNSDDVLVLNNTQVFPARLIGKKITGGKAEIFLLQRINDNTYQALLGGRGMKIGDSIFLKKNLQATLLAQEKNNIWQVKFNQSGKQLDNLIEAIGATPLPPYIKVQDNKFFRQRYQTVYAAHKGSVAAPTAGLHFTDKLLKQLKRQGVQIFYVTLHVGLGTFAPVTATDITKVKLHSEFVSIDQVTARQLNSLKKQGKNIVAVGTTTARALEAMTKNKKLQASSKWINIYIYPGYKFKFVSDLITNFHLPKSSLLFMVSALAGRNKIIKAYQTAVKQKYHFFSFGDAMFITKNR